MSGPKVVRIVTREEAVAVCKRMLARSDAALNEWIRVGQKNDCLDGAAIAAARDRSAQMAVLLTSDRFLDVQKQAQAEEMFLRSDIKVRLASVASKEGAKKAREQRKSDAAHSLLAELRKAGKQVDSGLAEALQKADDEAMARGFAMLGAETSASSDATKAQADLLRGGIAREKWVRPPDPVTERLEGHLSVLSQLLGDDDRIPVWEQRILEADLEPDRARRNLLVDGLEIDLGRATASARHLVNLREELQLSMAELQALQVPSPTSYEQLTSNSLSPESLESAIAMCRLTIDQHQAEEAATARRAAVLKGLAGLGYEVTEGMSTLWVEQGRVVIRKAATPEYGVEIAGNGASSRLQVRAIAFSNSDTDPRHDADVETLWCGDVAKLSAQLGEAGSQLIIERALPIGKEPLKRVTAPEIDASQESRQDDQHQMRRQP